MNEPAYRILDASLNRASEALRTIEDYTRFAIDDAQFTGRVKALRHCLVSACSRLERSQLVRNRDTRGDCGVQISIASERSRASLESVVAAAFARLQQSLRSIEEYGKLVSESLAAEIEQLRYESYTLEKELALRVVRPMKHGRSFAEARLYLLVDLSGPADQWLERLQKLAAAGADVIQIRDKRADDRTLWQRCKLAAEMLRETNCWLIVNDRADIAAAVDADGVHVGQEELPVEVVRSIVGEDKLVGLSTHSVEQIQQAVDCGADYIGCGPTFPSNTKTFDQYVGVALAAGALRDFSIPAFAIGGIQETNLDQLVSVGVHRVAVSGAVWGQSNEVDCCRRLARRLDPLTR